MAAAYVVSITLGRSRTDVAQAPTFEAALVAAQRYAEQESLRLVPTGDGRYFVSNYPRRFRGFGDPELWIEGDEAAELGDGDEPDLTPWRGCS